MDLLLTHGYFLYDDPKELQIMKPYVPLGLLYICSHLRAKGYHVDVYDSTFSAKQDLLNLLRTSPPGLLGVYANLMTRGNVVDILAAARECGWRTRGRSCRRRAGRASATPADTWRCGPARPAP